MNDNDILKNPLIQSIIQKLNLNPKQIQSGIDIFKRIIEEQNKKELNFRTQIAIYDENNVIDIIVPSGKYKKEIERNKYLLLNDITFLNQNTIFNNSNLNPVSINNSEEFFWKIKEAPKNNRANLTIWLKNFYNEVLKKNNKKGFKGFYIYGSFGLGKTTFLSAFANYLIDNHKKVIYIKVNDLANRLKKFFEQQDKFYEYIEIIKNVDYLLIDDIGNEKISEWFFNNVLYTILDFRLSFNLMTCFTSNYNYNNLKDIYTKSKKIDINHINRLIDRISSLTSPIELIGENVIK